MRAKGAAFFDVDGTLVRGNIVRYYAWIRLRQLPVWARPFWIAGFLPRTLYYLWLDSRSRRRFNAAFYRNYRGMTVSRLEAAAEEHARGHLIPNLYPDAERRIQDHRQRGQEVYFVTGSLACLVQPLARHLGVRHVEAAVLARDGQRFTGALSRGPLTDVAKRDAILEAAARDGIDLKASTAYADSWDDLPMLQCAGHAVTVNPQAKLRAAARERGWEIVDWKLAQ